jgi:hypothetical protein
MRVNNTVLQIKSSCVCNYKQCITLYLFSVWSYYQEFYLVCGRTIKSVWYYNNTTSSICKILHTKSIELFHFIFVISHLLLCLMFKLACVCVCMAIISLTFSHLLICRGMSYPRKLHYGSRANDPMYQSMKKVITKI